MEPSFPHGTQLPPFSFASRRSPVHGTRHMAAASQPLAVSAALDVLGRGGSAADACVAMAAVLAVTEPPSTGLGGDAFVLHYDPADGSVSALNGSGRSPAGLTLERVLHAGGLDLPARHPLFVTTPGACAAWCDLHGRFGALDLGTVLEPAIRLARDGFAVGPVTSQLWAGEFEESLGRARHGRELSVAGRAPHPGERFSNPGMAGVLEAIAREGKQGFYLGDIAAAIVEEVRHAGGALALEDLAFHLEAGPDWNAPIETPYRDARVLEHPPNGQGIAALMALNILTALEADLSGDPMSAARLHLVIESLRLAFADVHRYVADPSVEEVPVRELLDPAYAAGRARLIRPDRAAGGIEHGHPVRNSDTVYFCAVDSRGAACSMINSVYMSFGSGLVPKGLGFTLHNRGRNFSLVPGRANTLAPSKRPFHTIIPGMLLRPDGSLLGPFGVMGAFMQPQGHVQVLSAMLDCRLDPQAALDLPRFCITDGDPAGVVAVEEGIPGPALEALSAMGHKVRPVGGYGRGLFGRGQVILRSADGRTLCGGSDPRSDGLALGV